MELTVSNGRTVEFVRDLPMSKTGATVKLWKVSPPVKYTTSADDDLHETEYVVTSAVVAMFSGPETYIFPATKDGKVVSFLELPGSFQGALDHEQAIAGLNDEGAW